MGGTILGAGTIIRRIKLKVFICAWCFMFLGMIIGFKLINEPMIVYFSNPDNPRPESWAALLLGAVAFLVFMRVMLKTTDFKIVLRFAILGLAGGGLGFGVGSLWIIAGSHLQDSVIFQNWWKCMEWTFGFLLGGSLGLAVWLNRNELLLETTKQQNSISVSHFSGIKELFIALLGGLIIYVVIPYSVQELMKLVNSTDNLLFISGKPSGSINLLTNPK